jgi:CubicO group peptidase (beta-lactamase class C family)
MACLAAATAVAASAASHAADGCDFSGVDQAMQNVLATDGISDGAVLIGSPQGIWFKRFYGSYDDATVIPIASASKLLSGIRILQLADRHVVDLDAPVTDYLSGPDYPWSATAAPITLRQMFSHTAGYGDDSGDPALGNRTINLLGSAQEIAADSPQNYAPAGTQFAYGGVSMQIGGAVAQSASGIDWQRGWKDAVGAPLCASSIDWQGLGPTLNYQIAGGAEAALEDYARVLAMLADDGVGNGTRILDDSAIDTLMHSQIGDASIAYVPPGATGLDEYSIGAWIEPAPTSISADAPVIHSIGAFGYAPWVDFSNHTFGIIMVFAPNQADQGTQLPSGYISRLALESIVQTVRQQLATHGGVCRASSVYDAIYKDGFETTPPPPTCPGVVAMP